MKTHFLIFSMITFCALSISAQTPYDNSTPEQSSEPMIELSKLSLNLDKYNIFERLEFNSNNKWLTRDPHEENDYWNSPYVFCNNNPVKYIDPNGKDWFLVDVNGNSHRIQTKTEDRIFMAQQDEDGNWATVKDENGEIKTEGFDYGTIKSFDGEHLDLALVKGDENGQKVFEFLADNTNVEWTWAKVGTEQSEQNVIGTDKKAGSTSRGHYLRDRGFPLREVNHNHPNNSYPSSEDIKNATLYQAQFPNIKLNVYISKYGYVGYDMNSIFQKKIINLLPAVDILPE
jgi:hypothetical protein